MTKTPTVEEQLNPSRTVEPRRRTAQMMTSAMPPRIPRIHVWTCCASNLKIDHCTSEKQHSGRRTQFLSQQVLRVGFDNLSPTSRPPVRGKGEKVGGEGNLIHSTGASQKPSPDRIFEPRGADHGARSFVRLSSMNVMPQVTITPSAAVQRRASRPQSRALPTRKKPGHFRKVQQSELARDTQLQPSTCRSPGKSINAPGT